MNFSEQIINVLDYLGGKMGIAIDWTNANVLPYVEQLCAKYITWEIATSVIWLLIYLTINILLIITGIKFIPKIFDIDNTIGTMLCLVVIISIIGFFCGVFEQVFDITKCICFPEMQIYEYVTSLMSNNS